MLKLARRMGRAKPSAIMVIADKARQLRAAGRDIINFSIGVPNFLPGAHVYEAARTALASDSGQYGANRGAPELLDAFLAHIGEIGLEGYARENCAVAIGAKHILYNLAEALLDEGDEIAFATPYWTSYLDIAEIAGAKIKLLPCPPEQNYKITPAQLDAALSDDTRVFLFNNPSNPTGMVYDREEIAALADVLVKYPVWVITDDIYNRMVFDGIGYHNFVNARPELRDRVIFVDSLSKTYGMPGWRVGFMAGPAPVAQAVAIAMQADGAPVQVIWSREEDMRQDYYRPAVSSHFRAAFDSARKLIAWENTYIGKNEPAEAAHSPYDIPNKSIAWVDSPTHVPFGAWRSVAHSQHTFFMESFVDELAHHAGKNPYQFRMELLADKPRHARVLRTAAEKANWERDLPEGHALGIALQESFGSITAQIAEVSIGTAGAVRVHRVTCALDCGRVVHPDTAASQVEGGIIYGLTAALYGQITIDRGQVVVIIEA